MRVPAIRNINTKNTIKNSKTKIKQIRNKIPRKVTIENLPTVAGVVGLMVPLPFTSVAFFGIGKVIQIVAKKFLHKP